MRIDQSGELIDEDDDEDGDSTSSHSYATSDRLRRPERFAEDPSVWLAQHRMSQTEVGLRVGAFLLSSGLATTTVVVLLAGYEMTRRERPQFPARRFLTDRLGLTTDIADASGWRGTYYMKGRPHPLSLDWDKHAGHVATFLPSGQRLVVFVTAGLLRESRSPAEHTRFWRVLGRAIASPLTDATDLLAVCVPRSERYRKLAAEFRQAEGIVRSRLSVLTVDRTGYVDGLQSVAGH
jgi:hypothetical protein